MDGSDIITRTTALEFLISLWIPTFANRPTSATRATVCVPLEGWPGIFKAAGEAAGAKMIFVVAVLFLLYVGLAPVPH